MALEQQTEGLFARLYAMNRPFEPTAYFDPELDQLIYLRANQSYRANRIDERLTLLWNSEEMTLVGVKIKGFRNLFEKMKECGLVEEKHFIPLCKALSFIFHTKMEADEKEKIGDEVRYKEKLYRQAEKLVGDYRFDERNLLRA